MLLKRLEMQGFKSFADKTVLDFVNGATAVVGPNGSGKSNISDAIRWVIGETRAKSLRGSNMHDVIFAGTQTRKPLNFAEVSLVLDNSEHIFPVDYEEVVVTRRLFRSGESVYQINRNNCLLKNIHELFMDTGLGRDGYSIIGQGNVSQILSTKAEDRRSLFEEAAGVSKYKYRKDEASRKLSHVEENLVRINDIVSEIEMQINPLKNQSEKARKYLDFYSEYKTLDINMSLVTIEKNNSNLEKNEELRRGVEQELNSLRLQESETEEKINKLYDDSRRYDEEQTEKNSLLVENEAKVSRNANEIKIFENNIRNNHSNIQRIDAEIENIKAKNHERESKISLHEETIRNNNEAAKEFLKGFDAMQFEDKEMDEKLSVLRDRIDEARNRSIEKQNNAVSLREKISGIENLRSTYLSRREIVEAEIKSFNEGISSTKREIKQSEEEIKVKREKCERISKNVNEQNEKAYALNKKITELSGNISALEVDYNSKVSKKRILEGMENAYEGYAKSVKLVLQSEELRRLSIYGTLSGLIEVNKKYVTAIETALGNALQNIVVETENDARDAIEFLRQNKGGRATFLPISSVKARTLDKNLNVSECEGYVGIAADLVSYDAKYDGIIKNLLGLTVVADNINHAISMSKKFGYKFRIVTLEGDVTNPGGSISGGSVHKNSGFLSRSAEIKELHKEINHLRFEMADKNIKLEKLNKDLDIINNQLSSYVPLMREYEDEILRLENTIEHLNATVLSHENSDLHTEELKQLEEDIKTSSEEVAKLLSAVRGAENEAKALGEEVEDLEAKQNEILNAKQEKSKNIMEGTLRLAELENEIKSATESIENIKNEVSAAISEINEKEKDKERICKDNDDTFKKIHDNTKKAEEIKTVSENLRKEIENIDAKKADITRELQNIQSSNKDLTDTLLKLREELSRLEAKAEKLANDKDNILNRLWDEYELTLSSAIEMRTEVEDEKAAFKRLSELRSAIKALGSVNVDAIEEYKALKERFEFLTTQKNDLEKSKDNLNKIITSMEELMEEHFGTQFTEINKSFGEVFRELFGGGSGKLYLSDPDNILESGIEIEVQLPGKGLQNINLYSGGEKSFIAIALLFAILKVKPTPFCILDEIDAALDDVNVSRFATYLKNYTDNTQFIVITHRRGTMEAANILYGVTMQEKGVTKLLSLMIDDVDDELIK